MIMKIINNVVCLVVLCLFTCCKGHDDAYYFNGEIHTIDKSGVSVVNVQSKPVTLNGANTGMIAVYDSLLFCWSPMNDKYFFNVFNVDSGDDLGFYVNKGRGAKEALSVNCIYQFFKKGDDLMTLLYASGEGKLFFWNISKSIEQGMTVYDTIIPFKNNRMFFHFYQSDDRLLAYQPASDALGMTQTTTPFYERRSIFTNELLDKFFIYKQEIVENSKVKSPLDFFFYSWDVMKPDGSKIVQVMRKLPQINIIDSHTGEVVGYRVENEPGFSLLETNMEFMNDYYTGMHADDDYIYASYWGKEQWNDLQGNKVPDINIIHVLDWSGKLCYKLVADRSYLRIWHDKVRNRLYSIDVNTDEVYYLDLNDLD